jgi:hypothetical protein
MYYLAPRCAPPRTRPARGAFRSVDDGVKLLRGPIASLCARSALAVLTCTISRLAARRLALDPLATLSARSMTVADDGVDLRREPIAA